MMLKVLLVEHRDEVSARLAAGLEAAGFRVEQAKNSAKAVKRYVADPTDLLIVNADQTADSAWLLAAKVRLTHPTARIWAYLRQSSVSDVTAANSLPIEELIEYGENLSRLTADILDRLGVCGR
ncbi:MAG: hypothetical protein A2V70_02405 [Planctomycetes bacterium RBG_13_63_9]|nr:MAG: hypothetical protein A2V70_02405 [Planctomycetes bacterium RBG_13_63_9]